MKKRKVQSIIFYCDANHIKHFLLLKMNERRGGHWQSVTGGVDENESFAQAAIRESKEETNILDENILKLHPTQFEFEFHDQWKNDVIEKVFLLQAKNKFTVTLDPTEHSEFKWVEQNNINSQSVHFDSNFKALTLALDLKC